MGTLRDHRDAWREAPRDSVELEVRDLWASVLGIDEIGLTDTFLELGGDSLAAVSLLARMGERFGLHLGIEDVDGLLTVASMAERVREAGVERTAGSVVSLRSTGSRPPLLCFHPVGGTVLPYIELMRALGPDQPVYGFQARGLNPAAAVAGTIPEMAAAYLGDLSREALGGPFHLFGYSMGGFLAFEAARQLTLDRQPVGSVTVVDAVPGRHVELTDRTVVELLTTRVLRLDLDLEPLLRCPRPELARRILAAAVTGHRLPAGYDVTRVERLLEMYTVNREALARYVPGRYDGTLTVIAAADATEAAPAAAWRRLCGEVVVHVIPTDHFSIWGPSWMPAIAAHARAAMDGRASRDS